MAARVAWLQLTDVAVFVNGLEERTFQISASRRGRLLEIAQRLQQMDIAPHFISWLRPTEHYLTECARVMRPLCTEAAVRSLLFDVEEPWTKNVRGEAGARRVVEAHWNFSGWPCELGITGIVALPASLTPVAERCDYTLPQAYSVRKNSQTVYMGSDRIERTFMRPGPLQERAHEIWREFRNTFLGVPYAHKPIVMGLAAWNLNRPDGISQTQAMQRAIEATENLQSPSVQEVTYWSLRWVTESEERAAFVRQATMKARTGIAQSSAVEFEMSLPV